MDYKGLSAAEVKSRMESGRSNVVDQHSSRSLGDIIKANIFTRFNFLITALAIVVLLAGGGIVNALFFCVLIVNAVIGVAQEWRAKKILDKAAILVKPQSIVVRDGNEQVIASSDIVVDDVIKLSLGDQVPVDGVVLSSSDLEINESLLTGESDPVVKNAKSKVMSGSMVVAGSGYIKATKVGQESYSANLTRNARQYKTAKSEIVDSTNQLLKWISWSLVAVVPILIVGIFIRRDLTIDHSSIRAVLDSISGDGVMRIITPIVGMIPEGLVLLTSTAFMLAAVKLVRNRALVQQMPAVETLARVNTILLDKTGTITMGTMKLTDIELITKADADTVKRVIKTIASRASSPTNDALVAGLRAKPAEFTYEVAFSSARKWSAMQIDKINYIMGAPEIVLAEYPDALKRAQEVAAEGKRVLALVKSDLIPRAAGVNFKRIKPLALVVLSEQIRPSAKKTLSYFASQGVDIKVISGDSPVTVGAVAKSVGLDAKTFDARRLPDPDMGDVQREEFMKLIEQYNVFGRVQPEQKRQICRALQDAGQVVAMTGDGVNDALALKQADLGVAMNSGATATKAVAELVLLDSDFAHLPLVLSEGRRVIANIERVANLFIIKNVYSLVLALLFTFLREPYPLMPKHMTVISVLSIGMPAFFLALAPNNKVYIKGFMKRVLKFAIPVGVVSAMAMVLTYKLARAYPALDVDYFSTAVSIVMMGLGLLVLIILAQPMKLWKAGLITTCAGIFALVLLLPRLNDVLQYKFSCDLAIPLCIGLFVGVYMISVITWLTKSKRAVV